MTNTKPPKLAEIAARIDAHLKRMEADEDRQRGKMRLSYKTGYFQPAAWEAGSRVGICYISYQHHYKLTKADALEYLSWLDAGNSGRHSMALSFNQRIRETAP